MYEDDGEATLFVGTAWAKSASPGCSARLLGGICAVWTRALALVGGPLLVDKGVASTLVEPVSLCICIVAVWLRGSYLFFCIEWILHPFSLGCGKTADCRTGFRCAGLHAPPGASLGATLCIGFFARLLRAVCEEPIILRSSRTMQTESGGRDVRRGVFCCHTDRRYSCRVAFRPVRKE